MTRPNTRSKNKRPRTEDSDLSAETLRKIHFTGEITESDIRQLYSISKPICQGCRGNSKDSPNCFCGLIPPPNGSRKTGLWQRMPDIIRSLGPDPNKDIRTSTETPAGLTNLGATCYANSILQCLYMTTSFRNRIFSLEHELLKHRPVLDQLARLFAQLHSSKMAFIDSAPFIKTLDLDNGVQQDSHEFLTLFLSLLERSLCHSKVANAKTAVQDLFRGNVSHVTRCSVCGNDSEASSKMEDFYELELNIKGLNNLDESLDDYLNVEELSGENQYFCYSCDERVDATRSIKLCALPEVLNFQLRRYAFLSETTTRKKITSAFSFPRWLNMGRRLSNPCDSGLIYELFAILIHKGTAVNSGHYVAHIKDEKSGQWWEFDDEHVSKLGCHPFGEASSKSSAKSQPKGQLVGSDTKESDLNGDHVFPSKMKDEVFSSTDAYMLMYILRKENYNDRSSSSSKNNSLPLHLDEEIQEFNSTIDSACMAYQQKKDKNVDYITERRTEVKSILSEAPVDPNENSFFWISTEWLRLWADSITSSSIDNSPIQCLHGKAPISKVTSMKRLSNTAWKILQSKYGGGPTLSSDDICIDCIKDEAKNAVCAGDFRDRKASFRQLAEAALAGNCAGAPAYYVSRTWLTQWLRKKDSNCSSDNDTGPTTSLQCSHGNLLPEQASGAKHVLVPEELWIFFTEASNSLETSHQMGFLPFPSSSESCGLCNKELNEVASLEDSLRATKLKQRQNHEKLFARKSVALDPGCKYFLVPSSWLGKWRAYVTTTGKNVFSSAEPENLEGTIGSLICRKHSRLLERPCELIHKHGCITQKITTADGLILILENDWVLFCEEWSVKNVKGIQAEIVVEDLGHSTVNASDASVPSKFFIKTVPEVCEDCIRDRESCEFIRKLNYTDQDIRVNLVRGKKAPKSIMDSSGSVSELDRRTSKRSRKTSFGKSVKLTVSGSTSIYDLKMMIWEAFGVVRENQKLSKGLMDIEGDSATLADMNIFPGDVLLVTDTKIFENRDIADDLLMNSEPSQTEEGFRGTLLSSDLSVQISQDT